MYDYVDITFDLPFTHQDDAKVDAFLDEVIEYMHARRHCCSEDDVASVFITGSKSDTSLSGCISVLAPHFDYVSEYRRWAEERYQNVTIQPGNFDR